jgi:hypothetical protein
MSNMEPELDGFMLDLKSLIATLVAQHKYFDVHLVGENGIVRVKVNYQDASYDLKGKQSLIERRR